MDVENIVETYYTESKSQKEVARQFRVTPTLIHCLISEHKTQAAKLRTLKAEEKEQAMQMQQQQTLLNQAGQLANSKLADSENIQGMMPQGDQQLPPEQ